MNFSNLLSGKKTFILVIGSLLAIAMSFFNGDVDSGTAITEAIAALGVGSLRMGVSTDPAMTFLAGYKTHIIVVIGLGVIVANFLGGSIDATTAIQQGMAALGLSTLRMGVEAVKKT